jgi:predicted nucleic acid-binding protein
VTVIDSSGWIEYFVDGPNAEAYEPYIRDEPLVIPSIVLYEVHKIIRREASEEQALIAAGHLQGHGVTPLDEALALDAAEASLSHGLAMADAIVFATAARFEAELVTSDADLKGLPRVTYIAKG